MAPVGPYEQIITGGQVERAVGASVELWINDYLGEMERIEDYEPGSIARPNEIIASSDLDKWNELPVPVVLVVNGGTQGKPKRRGLGAWEATWLVALVPIVSDQTVEDSRKLAGAYAGAVRAAILQHKRLKSPLYPAGFASFLMWEDEKYDPIPFLESRTLAAGHIYLSVGVENVTTEQAGPRIPYPEPEETPGPWPTIQEPVQVETELVPIGGKV